ncbi:MAG: FAD-binding oxidoreductase [Chloroflexi bacterium]|nr:FAD-binding oxidoreductase [Chloroflexota bacterium]
MKTYDVIVIGGGILGGAVAFYLAKQKAGKILLLERGNVGQGNSSLAAGLLTRGRFKSHLIPMVLETYRAIEEIEAASGEFLNMRQTGCLYAAVSPDHQKEIADLVAVSSQAGLKVEWLDKADATRLVPWLVLPQHAAVAFMPDDGYIDGYTFASGYIKTARSLGVEVLENTVVFSILRDGGRITGVRTANEDISAPVVIDAAGVWAGMLAYEIGVGLPMAPIRSHYWITETRSFISPIQPFVILPDARAYARPESNRLLFGIREKQSASIHPASLPHTINGLTFRQDPRGWETLMEGAPKLSLFFPQIDEIKVTNYIHGLSNYTPDGNFVVGAFPGLVGFIAATGCAGAGLAMSGGIGRLVAELVTGQNPFVDPAPHRIDRFGVVDPTDSDFIQRCADARSGKVTG